jgi:type IV secretory pathway VirB10-like protein
MNTSYEKERLKKTTIVYLVVMVLIVVLILLAVQDTQVKTVAVILVLLVGAAAIIVQWLLLGKKGDATKMQEPVKPVQSAPQAEKSAQKASSPVPPKQEKKEEVSTQTGSQCEIAGVYHCSEHPDKTVTMEEGKRFPPCRGDDKGHSATWVLES